MTKDNPFAFNFICTELRLHIWLLHFLEKNSEYNTQNLEYPQE